MTDVEMECREEWAYAWAHYVCAKIVTAARRKADEEAASILRDWIPLHASEVHQEP